MRTEQSTCFVLLFNAFLQITLYSIQEAYHFQKLGFIQGFTFLPEYSAEIGIVSLCAMRREYLPLQSLPAWARLNGIVTNGVAFQNLSSTESDTEKGNAIVATENKSSNETDSLPQVLLQIPRDLVLSLDAVHDYSKSDRDLREVLEAVEGFGRVRLFLIAESSWM